MKEITTLVVDASPLIFLGYAGHLPLLDILASRVIVPEVVAGEVEAGDAFRNRNLREQIVRCGWIEIVSSIDLPAQLTSKALDAGEAQVLAWAFAHPGSEVVVDDAAARRCATGLGIPVRGTAGLLIAAKERGVVAEVKPILDQIRQSGLYLSEKIYLRVLRQAAEL